MAARRRSGPCAWCSGRSARRPEATGPPHQQVVRLDTGGAKQATIGEHPQWDGRILQITRFQGSLGGFEGSIIQFCGSTDGSPKLRARSMAVERETKVSQVLIEARLGSKSEEAVRRLSAGVRTRLGLHLQCPVRFGHEAPAERLPTQTAVRRKNPQTPGCHLGRRHPNQPGRGWDQARAVSYDRPFKTIPKELNMCSGVCGAAVIWLASFVDVDATPSNEVMTPVAAEMRQHAESFLAALSDAQRLSAQKSIDDESRTDWTFFPRVRDGLELADLRENAVAFAAAEALLDCGLSESGAKTAADIRRLDPQEDRGGGVRLGPDRYAITIFGQPSSNARWGWRVEDTISR